MKIEGYEEISKEEYDKLPNDEGLYVQSDYENKELYFKKVQKFPIVFEDDDYKIKVGSWGMEIINKMNKEEFDFAHNVSFPLLVKAVEKAKEVMKKEK